MMNPSFSAFASLILLSAALSAQTTYQVDFGVNTQLTTATGWNNMTDDTSNGATGNPQNLTGIVDSVGNSTSINITYSEIGVAGTAGSAANYAGPYPPALATYPTSALQDGLFFAQDSGTATLTITGLDNSRTYDFILYGARGNNGDVDTTFSVTGSNSSGVINVGPVLNNNDDFADIKGISPTAAGVITVTATSINGASNNGGALNLMVFSVTATTDADEDGMPDSYETANGTDPNEDGTLGETSSGAKDGPNGALGDKDSDGLTNLQEFLGHNAADAPTGYGPTLSGSADSDSDGLNDYQEIYGTLNPWTSGVLGSPPGDSTNPNVADSDDDGVSDGSEITSGSNPNAKPPNSGPTFPFVDTDGDSYRDGAETAFGSNPNDPISIPNHSPNPAKPNVVIIYADDMGLGDMSAYGNLFGTPSPAITPHMDSLASQGVMFTQAHSSNGVCTPSRYALLTGKYNWRLFDSITLHYGYDPDPSRGEVPLKSDTTIAEFLKARSYDTAAFGKWHLGGYWYQRGSNARVTTNPTDSNAIDWARPVADHAVAHGFDLFRGLGVSINIGPYVYLENDRVQFWDSSLNGGAGDFRNATNSDTFHYFTTSELNSSVVGAKDSRASLGDPSYRQVDAEPIMIQQVEDYLAERANTADPDPFFAYVALYSPHMPWALTPPFIGADSARGFHYADWMREVDHRIGRVLAAIDNNGFHDNTLVVLTSDNGPENNAMSQSLSFGKDPNGPLRGNKRDVWDGGTRVPFVVRWPGQAAPGLKVSDTIWQGDIFATVAAYLGAELPTDVAPDGESFLNLIRGQQKPAPHRDSIIVSSMNSHLGLKTIDGWKFIDATRGGGDASSWDSSNVSISSPQGSNQGTPKQLFHQAVDLGEDDNLISSLTNNTQIRNELTTLTGRDLLGEIDQYRTQTTSQLFPRRPDNDADGMPNSFEVAYGLDPDSPKDANTDLDGDGQSNLSEFIAGTDPTNALSLFRVLETNDTVTGFSVTWPSSTGRSYSVYWTNDFTDWHLYSQHTGTGGILSETLDKPTIDAVDGIPGNLTRCFVRVTASES